LGDLYYNGLGVPQDFTEAAKWYRKAAEQEDAVELDYFSGALCRLGELYDRGLGVPKDHVEASKWYGKAAVGGVTEALEWCRKAAKQGDKNLQDLLHENGWD
jgi:TPR repeat protein